MVDNPYQVLGVAPTASSEEIKKAYRKKAKECHPDLHPNDPKASDKMNEVNEAYDMLTNPEKYAGRRAQQQSRSSYGGYQSGSGGYGEGGYRGSGSGYGSGQSNGYGNGGYRGTGNNQESGGYQGAGGWTSDFGGFGFEDLFGFGGAQRTVNLQPHVQAGDSSQIQFVVNSINSGRYQDAINTLTFIPSTGRNARWYYLSALANHGLEHTVQSVDHMMRAVQLEPNNQEYHQLLQYFRQQGQTYESNAQGYNMQAMSLQKICCGLCGMQLLCGPCSTMFCR